MKKALGSVLLLASVYAAAGENYFQTAWDAKGLLALEGGFGQANPKETQDINGGQYVINDSKVSSFSGGLKLGGESEDYRLFISARYHEVEDFDYAATAGAEIQYLIRAGENFNVFLGLNGGVMKSQKTVGPNEYTTSNPYVGGDAGVNIDITNNFGVELGARVNKAIVDSSNVATIDYIAEGYASLVIKFTGAY